MPEYDGTLPKSHGRPLQKEGVWEDTRMLKSLQGAVPQEEGSWVQTMC